MQVIRIFLVLFPIHCLAGSNSELTQQQIALLNDYKKVTLLCAKSPVCRKINHKLVRLNEPSLLQMEINLKLMKEDLNQIKNASN